MMGEGQPNSINGMAYIGQLSVASGLVDHLPHFEMPPTHSQTPVESAAFDCWKDIVSQQYQDEN